MIVYISSDPLVFLTCRRQRSRSWLWFVSHLRDVLVEKCFHVHSHVWVRILQGGWEDWRMYRSS